MAAWTIVDDRTPEQRQTHTVLVAATDNFLSGWGKAKGGRSVAIWACTLGDSDRVESWVRSRSDMDHVRVVSDPYHGNYRDHVHIYVVCDGHPALGEKVSNANSCTVDSHVHGIQ